MVTIQIAENYKTINFDLSKIEKLVRNICKRFAISTATISIAIIGDDQIRKVNKKFLNRSSATDCISFDLSDNNSERSFELLVNAQKADREAKKRNHSSEAELALYITHGLLHQLGFNDSNSELAKKMHETEDKILTQNGFGLVYNSKSNLCEKNK